MMLAYRLVRLIETHSDSTRCRPSEKGSRVPTAPATTATSLPEELKQRVYEIYRHLGDWLLGKTEFDIKERYLEIGALRAAQHVPSEPAGMGDRSDQRESLGIPEARSRDGTSGRSLRRVGNAATAGPVLRSRHLLRLGRIRKGCTAPQTSLCPRRICCKEKATMSWEMEYKKKLRTAGRGVALRAVGHAGLHSPGLRRARDAGGSADAARAHVQDVEIVHMMTMGSAPYVAPEMAGHFRHNAVFIGSNVREAINEGRADYTPIYLSEIEELFESGAMPIDVALIQVSPPDSHGFCSFGVGVDTTLTAARLRTLRGCAGQRPDAAHLRRQLHPCQQDRCHRGSLPARSVRCKRPKSPRCRSPSRATSPA